MSGRRTTLVWRRRRFECGNCGERHLEDHDQFQGGLSRRFARRLVADATVMSIRAASRHHGWVGIGSGRDARLCASARTDANFATFSPQAVWPSLRWR